MLFVNTHQNTPKNMGAKLKTCDKAGSHGVTPIHGDLEGLKVKTRLAATVVAVIKKSNGVAVGNILGSNIFNLLFIIGIDSLFFTIPSSDPKDTLVMIGFTFAIFPFFIRNNRIRQIWGVCFLLLTFCIFCFCTGSFESSYVIRAADRMEGKIVRYRLYLNLN